MRIENIKNNEKYLKEYIKLCSLEWGNSKTEDEMNNYIENKLNRILTTDKVIFVLGLFNKEEMIGFISLFKYDGDERRDLTPWYATMYVKKEYRGNGYSKLLNDALIEECIKRGYDKIYLKSDLINYYQKFGAKYMDKLNNGETLYYIDCKDEFYEGKRTKR